MTKTINDYLVDPDRLNDLKEMWLNRLYQNIPSGAQAVRTPLFLCQDIVGKLVESVDISDKIVAVLNLEFIEPLLSKVEEGNIWFFADCGLKANYVKRWFPGVNVIESDLLKWEQNMKFDVVVGNPPYKDDLHVKMLSIAVDMSKKHVAFVQPSNFIINEIPSDIEKEVRNKIANVKKCFTFFNGNGVFKIGMYMPCCISILDLEKHDKKATVINQVDKTEFVYPEIEGINKFGNIPEYFSLRKKFCQRAQKDNLFSHFQNSGKFFVCLARVRGHVVMKKKDGMFSEDFFTLIPKDLSVETEATKFYNFAFDNEICAKNFLVFLKTKIARASFSMNKNGSSIRRKQLEIIPWLDFSKEWDDIRLRKEFNITDLEWKFIESIIPDYY